MALFGHAVFALTWFAVMLWRFHPSAGQTATLFVVMLPELAGGLLALRMRREPVPRWAVLGVLGVEIALGLADLGTGNGLAFVQVIGPVVLAVLAGRDRTPGVWAAVRPFQLRPSAGDRGATGSEYAALIVLASLILGSLFALGLQSKVGETTKTALCHVTSQSHCAPLKGSSAGADGKGDPLGKSKSKCHGFTGFFKCLGKNIAGFFKGVGKTVAGIFKGLGQIFTDPGGFFKGIWNAITHPVDTLQAIFTGDAVENFKKGNWGEALGDIWASVGSLIIPGADVGDALGALAKAGKAGKAGKNGKDGKDGKDGKGDGTGKDVTPEKAADNVGKDADDALAAAAKGDGAGAAKAAKKADDDLKKAEDAAKKQGCPVALGGGPGVPALHHLGRFGVVAGPICSSLRGVVDRAKDAKAIAHEAADRARIVNEIGDAIRRGRYEDADNLINGLRDRARTAEDRAADRPSSQNRRAADDARRAVNDANRRNMNGKIDNALSSTDPNKRLEGTVGDGLRDHLVNFEKKYGRNGRDGEIDAETSRAIIEITNGTRAGGKVTQVNRNLASPITNPSRKPVIVYAPNMRGGSAAQIRRNTGATVVRNMDELRDELRRLGEPI